MLRTDTPYRTTEVTVTGSSGATNLVTNGDGSYARWPPGRYTLVAAMDGHVPDTAEGGPGNGRGLFLGTP